MKTEAATKGRNHYYDDNDTAIHAPRETEIVTDASVLKRTKHDTSHNDTEDADYENLDNIPLVPLKRKYDASKENNNPKQQQPKQKCPSYPQLASSLTAMNNAMHATRNTNTTNANTNTNAMLMNTKNYLPQWAQQRLFQQQQQQQQQGGKMGGEGMSGWNIPNNYSYNASNYNPNTTNHSVGTRRNNNNGRTPDPLLSALTAHSMSSSSSSWEQQQQIQMQMQQQQQQQRRRYNTSFYNPQHSNNNFSNNNNNNNSTNTNTNTNNNKRTIATTSVARGSITSGGASGKTKKQRMMRMASSTTTATVSMKEDPNRRPTDDVVENNDDRMTKFGAVADGDGGNDSKRNTKKRMHRNPMENSSNTNKVQLSSTVTTVVTCASDKENSNNRWKVYEGGQLEECANYQKKEAAAKSCYENADTTIDALMSTENSGEETPASMMSTISEVVAMNTDKGVSTSMVRVSWEARRQQLENYRNDEGHTNVSQRCKKNEQLGIWVQRQRQQYKLFKEGKKSAMTTERIQSLNDLGFVWSVKQGSKHVRVSWEGRRQQLENYRKVEGDTNVPSQYKKNKQLGNWVHSQRQYYRLFKEGKKSSMTTERIQSLNDLGFVWSIGPSCKHTTVRVSWETRRQQLANYRKVEGDTNVSTYCKKNKQLGTWVRDQRTLYRLFKEGKTSSMTTERIQSLNDLGFVWSFGKGQKAATSQFEKTCNKLLCATPTTSSSLVSSTITDKPYVNDNDNYDDDDDDDDLYLII